MGFLTTIKTWLAVAGGVVLAVGAALVVGLIHGRKAGTRKARETIAKARAKAVQKTIHAQEVRHEVEIETSRLPDAPTQRVGEADSDTAAGHLADRWMRERDAKD